MCEEQTDTVELKSFPNSNVHYRVGLVLHMQLLPNLVNTLSKSIILDWKYINILYLKEKILPFGAVSQTWCYMEQYKDLREADPAEKQTEENVT